MVGKPPPRDDSVSVPSAWSARSWPWSKEGGGGASSMAATVLGGSEKSRRRGWWTAMDDDDRRTPVGPSNWREQERHTAIYMLN